MNRDLFVNGTEALRENLNNPLENDGRSYFVPNGSGRRWVMTDIHGSFQTFMRLINKINLTKEDQFFILGDSIDRAPYSLFVLEQLCELLVDGFQVYPLRGNHEQLVLEFALNDRQKLLAMTKHQYSRHLLIDNELPQAVMELFSTFPYYYELNDYFLVHAGFDTEIPNPFDGWKEMLWIRSMKYRQRVFEGKKVIHGHVPKPLDAIKSSVCKESNEICLDNGCIRSGVPKFGHLVCLDLDSKELITQKNIDFLPA